ncbi:MAG: pyridoxamine 5'-phosphate oxidase, partial [Bacteroidota bacterium]
KQPSSRVVLLKEYDENGYVLYTNYESRKGSEIAENQSVSLLFFWKELERQVRIEGNAEKISSEQSASYFHSRPRESQIGALVSHQSSVVESRVILENKFIAIEQEYYGKEIPLPSNWGGYVVRPARIEFWQGRASRLHDRICYTKIENEWKIERLSP